MTQHCIQRKSFDFFRHFFDAVYLTEPMKNIRNKTFSFSRKWSILLIRNNLWKRGMNMKDNDCIFCKIAAGEIPSATLYEDEDFRVILDLGPASKGHALIIPKEHFRNLYDIDDETAAKAMVLAKKMVKKMTDVLGCDGYNVVQNNEECAGQTVFHFHMHLIPRYKGDQVGLEWKVGELTDEVKNEILEKMK